MAGTVVSSACYFPPAVFFRDYLSAKAILLDAQENFEKQTLRNRTYICGANGKFPLVIPVKHTGGKLTSVKDIQISYDTPWQRTHWRSITSAYRNSPFFEYYEDELAPLFSNKEKFLFDLHETVLETLFKLTGVTAQIARTKMYAPEYPEYETDLRPLSEPQYFFKQLPEFKIKPYPQVFNPGTGFVSGLSILDLLFNCGTRFAERL